MDAARFEELFPPNPGHLSHAPPSVEFLPRIIRDKRLTDERITAYIQSQPLRSSLNIDNQIDKLDEPSNMHPLALAIACDRPMAAKVLLQYGADPWLCSEELAAWSTHASCLATIRGMLAVMAPPGVPLANRSSKTADRRRFPVKYLRSAQEELGISSPPPLKNHINAWFDLVEKTICVAARGLVADPESVMKFIVSILPAWSARPIDVSRSWVDVMTAALDSMVCFLVGNKLLPSPEEAENEKCAAAIRCLVDLGANPDIYRLIPSKEGRAVLWSTQFELSTSPSLCKMFDQMRSLDVSADNVAHQEADVLNPLGPPPTHQSLWSIDSDQLPVLSKIITGFLLRDFINLNGEVTPVNQNDRGEGLDALKATSKGLLRIPIGQHAILAVSKNDGTVHSAYFLDEVDIRGVLCQAVMKLLPETLDAIELESLLRAAEKSLGSPWLNIVAYPGAAHDLRAPTNTRWRVSALKSSLSGNFLPPRYSGRTVDQDGDVSVVRRLVARLGATSLEETCAYIATAFVNRAISADRSTSRPSVGHPTQPIDLTEYLDRTAPAPRRRTI